VVLVDTSVWIKFLSGDPGCGRGLNELLRGNEVLAHELVYGELLIGDRGGRHRLLMDYERLHQAAPVAHDEVVEFVRRRGLHGRGIGWIDAQLLASAIVTRCSLWTADSKLAAIAESLKIGHREG
jgi:predicted nucleic acid-binding protein